MNALYNIWGVASYECKMLIRTTKFKLLGGIGVSIPLIIGAGFAVIETQGFELPYSGLGTFLPFYIYSFLQTLVIAFVVGDFRAADERANIFEVVASKPISTAELVAGKFLGVVGALVLLSLGVLFLTLVIQGAKVSVTGEPLSLAPFLVYFLLMNVPGLIYMSALTFFLGAVLKRQTAVALLVITYALGVLFLLGHRYDGIFDYGAFFAPLYYSDLLGLGDFSQTLQLRFMYLAFALGLFGLSIDRYPRLPQSKSWQWFGRCLVLVGLVAGTATYWNFRTASENAKFDRETFLKIQENYTHFKVPDITHYDLKILLNLDEPLRVQANLKLVNSQDVLIDTLILSLNPGLHIENILVENQNTKWERDGSVLCIKLPKPLDMNQQVAIQIDYAGTIDQNAFDLLRDAGEPRLRKRDGPINKGSMTAWIAPESVFLPARSGWYPREGVDYGYDTERPVSFASTHIEIQFPKFLQVITQGIPVETDTMETGIRQVWESEKKIPDISLNAGFYEKYETIVHNIHCVLYLHPKHTKAVEFFKDAQAEVIKTLTEVIDAMEQESGLSYPYDRLSIVEVPFLIQWYYEGWEETGGLTSPGVLMIEEDVLQRQSFRLSRDFRNQERRNRGNREPEQIKRDLFVRLLMETFFANETHSRTQIPTGVFRSPVVQLWSFDKTFSGEHYALMKQGMPMFLQKDLSSTLQSSLYSRRGGRGGSMRGGMGSRNTGFSSTGWDTLVAKMQQKSFAEIDPKAEAEIYRQVVEAKGPALFQMVEAYMGESKFLGLVQNLEEEYQYERIDFESFQQAVADNPTKQETEPELKNLVKDWLYSTEVPGYTLTRVVAHKVDDGFGMVVYQLILRIRNGEPGRGFVQITAMGRGDEAVKGVVIEGGQEVEVSMILWERPFRVMVEPFFARNRRPLMSPIRIPEEVQTGFPESYVKDVSGADDSFVEIIVDNDDDGFSMPVRRVRKFLRPELKGDNWRERTIPMAFGRYETNYRYKGPGDGAQPAVWETEIPKAGLYDVAYYFVDPNMARRFGIGQKFTLLIFHSNGIDTLAIERNDLKAGWNVLGKYNFTVGDVAKVELSDVSSGNLYADAIRWRYYDPAQPYDNIEEDLPTWGFGGQSDRGTTRGSMRARRGEGF